MKYLHRLGTLVLFFLFFFLTSTSSWSQIAPTTNLYRFVPDLPRFLLNLSMELSSLPRSFPTLYDSDFQPTPCSQETIEKISQCPIAPDHIVVLGALVRRGIPSRHVAQRVYTAMELFHRIIRRQPNLKLLVTGGNGGEAIVMARLLTEHGIPAERVIIESRARSTVENAYNSSRILFSRTQNGSEAPPPEHILLVTTSSGGRFRGSNRIYRDNHAFRAFSIFKNILPRQFPDIKISAISCNQNQFFLKQKAYTSCL